MFIKKNNYLQQSFLLGCGREKTGNIEEKRKRQKRKKVSVGLLFFIFILFIFCLHNRRKYKKYNKKGE